MLFAVWPWVSTLLNIVLVILSLFLMLLVLIQRGKGGGLAGAFGGIGGSSAFGSRAGDLFTRVTIIVAGVWIGLTMLQVGITKPTDAESQAPFRGAAPELPTGPAEAP